MAPGENEFDTAAICSRFVGQGEINGCSHLKELVLSFLMLAD